MHLVGADPLCDAGERVDPGLRGEDALAVVLVEESPPVAVDLVDAVLAPVRCGLGKAMLVLGFRDRDRDRAGGRRARSPLAPIAETASACCAPPPMEPASAGGV
ncbi:hypothetical protein GCM10025870_14130 [Agromyces marinus]|uniref:Uncharacterized protein n=1 Tax=Agromyces marinus TaxID=1389020 RepID=A0ABN6YAG5_9MICO|nr:hypothetical protein GCM10025870_14130 [Agromyces marinus]